MKCNTWVILYYLKDQLRNLKNALRFSVLTHSGGTLRVISRFPSQVVSGEPALAVGDGDAEAASSAALGALLEGAGAGADDDPERRVARLGVQLARLDALNVAGMLAAATEGGGARLASRLEAGLEHAGALSSRLRRAEALARGAPDAVHARSGAARADANARALLRELDEIYAWLDAPPLRDLDALPEVGRTDLKRHRSYRQLGTDLFLFCIADPFDDGGGPLARSGCVLSAACGAARGERDASGAAATGRRARAAAARSARARPAGRRRGAPHQQPAHSPRQ